jgi:hypothetical protein
MSPEDSRRVLELISAHAQQVEEIVLHLPDDGMNMRGWCDSSEYREVLAAFLSLERPHPRTFRNVDVMTMDRQGTVHHDLRSLLPDCPNGKVIQGRAVSIRARPPR